jgi:site-specific recombinase XerD
MQIIPLDFEALPDTKNPGMTYLAQLRSPKSFRTMKNALENIAQCLGVTFLDCPWPYLEQEHISFVLARLASPKLNYAPATINRHHAALRGVLKESWRHGYISAEQYMRLSDFKAERGHRELRSRYVSPQEFDALVATCGASLKGMRDKLTLYVLYMCGLRRDELVNLKRGNLKNEAIQLVGKGNKERTVPMNSDTLALMNEWLKVIGGDKDQYIFCNVDREPITAQTVYNMLESRSTLAGIEVVRPHDMRHAFISNLWDTGTDGATIAALAGHSNIKQTQQYDRRPEETKRRAVNLLNRGN